MFKEKIQSAGNVTDNVTDNVPKDVPKGDRIMHLLSLIAGNKWITISELAQKCNVNIKTIKRDIDLLKPEKQLIRASTARRLFITVIL